MPGEGANPITLSHTDAAVPTGYALQPEVGASTLCIGTGNLERIGSVTHLKITMHKKRLEMVRN